MTDEMPVRGKTAISSPLKASAPASFGDDLYGEREIASLKATIQEAIDLAVQYGGIDGAHHKTWVIDQMVRVLAGDRYEQIVRKAKDGDDGPESYDWDVGIPP